MYEPLPFAHPVTFPELGVHVHVKVVPVTLDVNVILVELPKQILLFIGEFDTFGDG